MREFWTIAAVFISLACFLIMGVPAIRTLRSWRRRRVLLRCFLDGLDDGQLRASHRRDKHVYGNFFIDSYHGTSGAMQFRLEARVEPFKDFHGVWFSLFRGKGASGESDYERWHIDWRGGASKGGIARIYEAVRDAGRNDRSFIEAS